MARDHSICVGLICLLAFLAAGNSLVCEVCSARNNTCKGKLETCDGDKDTCATILIETITRKKTTFNIIKSCFQKSKCWGSSTERHYWTVNVSIKCHTNFFKTRKRSIEVPANVIETIQKREVLPPKTSTPNPDTATTPQPTPTSTPAPNTDTTPQPTTTTTPAPATTTSKTTTATSEPTTSTKDKIQPTVASFLLSLSGLLLLQILL